TTRRSSGRTSRSTTRSRVAMAMPPARPCMRTSSTSNAGSSLASSRTSRPESPEAPLRPRGIAALLFVAIACAVAAAPSVAQAPIRIGEINSFSGIGAPFTGPYRQAVEMAVEDVNARGGVLGRKVEVLFRDDKGQPAEAVKHAQELVASEKVSLVSGTFLPN